MSIFLNRISQFLLLILLTSLTTRAWPQKLGVAPKLDSLKIVFVSYRSGTADIYMMDSDGESVERLTNSFDNNSFPYQIDKRTIGFTRTDSLRNSTPFKIDIHTKAEEPLTVKPVRSGAKWEEVSPDSRYIAFVRSNDYSDRDLFVYDKQTGYEKQVTSHTDEDNAAYSINHGWSSDSKKLVFMSGKDWYNQIIRIYDTEKESVLNVTSRGYMNSGLKWLNDDRTLIANLKIRDETMYEIYSIDSNTGELIQLTSDINLHPDVSPDGEWIVFESQRGGNDGEVYVMRKDGSNQVRLTSNSNYNGRCIWFKL